MNRRGFLGLLASVAGIGSLPAAPQSTSGRSISFDGIPIKPVRSLDVIELTDIIRLDIEGVYDVTRLDPVACRFPAEVRKATIEFYLKGNDQEREAYRRAIEPGAPPATFVATHGGKRFSFSGYLLSFRINYSLDRDTSATVVIRDIN